MEQILTHSRTGRAASTLERIGLAAAIQGLALRTSDAASGVPAVEGKTAGSIRSALSSNAQLPQLEILREKEEVALLTAAPPSPEGQSPQLGTQGKEQAFRLGVIPPWEQQNPQFRAQEEPLFRLDTISSQESQSSKLGEQEKVQTLPTLRFGVTSARQAGRPPAEMPWPVSEEDASFPQEELTYGPIQVHGANTSHGEAARQEKTAADASIKWSWQSAQNNLSFSADSPLQSGVGTRPMATARPIGALYQESGEEQIQWTAPSLSQRPAELSFRQQEPAASAPAPAPGLSDRELRQAADRVYQIIEDRLRQERRRLDL